MAEADSPRAALAPGFQDRDHQPAIRFLRAGDDAVARYADDIGDAGRLAQHGADRVDHAVRALQGGAIRQLHVQEEIALIFGRQEGRGCHPEEEVGRAEDDEEADHGDQQLARQKSHRIAIAVACVVEAAVEDLEADEAGWLRTPQHESAERRAQRQGIDRGDDDGDRNRRRELAVERAGHTRDEPHRCEDRDQDERGRHHRAGDFRHRLLGRLGHREVWILIQIAGHVLHHHDGVINHQGNGEHDGEEVDRVGGIAEHVEDGEDANERDRYGDGRDDGCPPVLQEEEHHRHDKHQGDGEGPQDLLDIRAHEVRRVVDDGVFHPLREFARHAGHGLLHLRGDGEGVGGRRLIHRQCCRREIIELRARVVLLRCKLHAGDVEEVHDAAAGVRPDDNILELLDAGQFAGRQHGQLLLLIVRPRRFSNLPGRNLNVLRLDCRDHLRRADAEPRHLDRVEPDPHRIFALAEDLGVADAGDARDDLLQMHIGVVRDRQLIERFVRRI